MVSPICLGCMMFGGKTEPEDSYKIIDRAIEVDINLNYSSTFYSERKLSVFLKELPVLKNYAATPFNRCK